MGDRVFAGRRVNIAAEQAGVGNGWQRRLFVTDPFSKCGKLWFDPFTSVERKLLVEVSVPAQLRQIHRRRAD